MDRKAPTEPQKGPACLGDSQVGRAYLPKTTYDTLGVREVRGSEESPSVSLASRSTI
jgi:hypothetical protein